ncbi:hypothetical protein ACRYCC_05070 [Actinomadura scrupuli]|uniref:hypothetical protein n=1 Tax=Actinomadura scrupuli TaxID=559629 RepID=UPI003D951D56
MAVGVGVGVTASVAGPAPEAGPEGALALGDGRPPESEQPAIRRHSSDPATIAMARPER